MNIDSTSASPAIKRDTALEKKLDSYLMLTGINDKVTARSLAQRHFSAHAGQYPYLLFRGRTLYLFTADGLSAAKQLPGTNTADYLRFDGERITRLEYPSFVAVETELAQLTDTIAADARHEAWVKRINAGFLLINALMLCLLWH